jgi:NAD(P)-dependent dehydrogenase (short-subunit alcohol dehydrogenase family)
MNILITGANRGIGLALAEKLAASGHSVVGTYRGAAKPVQSGAEWQQLDVKDPASHQALATRLQGRALDLLVCNAGVYLDRDSSILTDVPFDAWAETFAVNVTGVFLTIKHLLPNIRNGALNGGGKIAIISSQMGSDARAHGESYIYRASKAATLNLGRNLAVDLKPENIAVGIYHPGWVRTDMGGASADIDTAQSSDGLIERFAALGMANTGCFENWDGKALQF